MSIEIGSTMYVQSFAPTWQITFPTLKGFQVHYLTQR